MPRRTIHRRRRAQGGCLSFAIAALAVVALALVMAIVVTNRMKPPADRNEFIQHLDPEDRYRG